MNILNFRQYDKPEKLKNNMEVSNTVKQLIFAAFLLTLSTIQHFTAFLFHDFWEQS